MKFLDDIKNETIIICNESDKEKILMRNKLINIKVMSMNQFISKYCFDYDDDAIIYVMEKYNVKYEIALVYIKNLYYIEDKKYNIKKLDFLVNLKKELDENKLLKYNKLFREYINNVNVIIYGIRLGKYELNILKDIKYNYIEKDLNRYEHTIYSFDTMEEEVEYVAYNICKLID